MRLYLWLGGALLLLVAAGAVWFYLADPAWVAGLIAAGTAAVWKALKPAIMAEISRRKSPEDEEAWRKEQRGGIKPAPGTGVTTPKTITQPAKTARINRDR